MADWVLAAIGFCLRGFHAAVAAQQARRWAKDVFTDNTTVRTREFAGTRVGIVGLGGVGRAVAQRCVALGMEVRAIRRRADRRKPAGVSWVGSTDQITKLARQSDVLVVAAAHTPLTTHLVDSQVLAALPRGAFVVNVARGALLDEGSVLKYLDSGHIAGCVLDVFSHEPLPKTHPFWRHPSVTVFPHVSAVSERFWTRETALILENINRYLHGRRLKNIVDFQAGY
jgi:phosphoglycerate dehydrogenase-like enzyme